MREKAMQTNFFRELCYQIIRSSSNFKHLLNHVKKGKLDDVSGTALPTLIPAINKTPTC